MPDKALILGIDLGTTNTCAAAVRNKVPRMVPTDRGNLILPSVVALSAKGDLVIGSLAKDQMITLPERTIYGAKRLMGLKYSSKVVQDLKKYFAYPIVEGPNGDAAVTLGERVYSLPEISSLVLKQVKIMAEQFLGCPVSDAIISVPAYYNDNQRQAVKEAGRLAGFQVKRIVNEPTAAALAYGFNRKLDQRVLVYDLGGGTFDVSVLHISENVFEVLATGGDTFLGGVDFDNRIIDYVLQSFEQEHKINLRENPIAVQRIKAAAEAAKIDLTLILNVVIELPYITEKKGKPVDLRLSLTRDQLNALTADLVGRTFEICDQVLAEKKISPSEIDEVILVGGQSRMPLVQQKIQSHFGRAPRKGVHPDECVALGAAVLGESIGSIDSATLLDVLSMSIGFASGNGKFKKIIEKNLTIPLTQTFRIPMLKELSDPFIEMDIFQGDSDLIVDNEYLGSLKLPAESAGKKIDFRLTEECLLKVLIHDQPGQPLKEVTLSTRDTPSALKAALDVEAQQKENTESKEGSAKTGLLSSIKRIWGGE